MMACKGEADIEAMIQTEPAKATVDSVKEVMASVNENELPGWSITVNKVNETENLVAVRFVDLNNGWVASNEGALYKTEDGGISWTKVDLAVADGATVSGIFFTNPSIGWVSVNKVAGSYPYYKDNQSWVLKTEDGGKSWSTQYSTKSALISRLYFLNEQEGWATGMRSVPWGKKILDRHLLVLHTKNQGKNWEDVSKPLNKIAAAEDGIVQGWALDSYLEGSDKMSLFSASESGKIYKTDNGGKDWIQTETLPKDKNLRVTPLRFGYSKDGALWVTGGKSGYKGGEIGMVAKRGTDNTWIRYITHNIDFNDAIYLSDGVVVACGWTYSQGYNRAKHGVILVSHDGGINWTIAYRNTQIESINTLTAVGEKRIWAVGNNGITVSLSRF